MLIERSMLGENAPFLLKEKEREREREGERERT
jgi:hypothetical protein